MIDSRLVLTVLLVEAGVVGATVLILVAHGLLLGGRRTRRDMRSARARALLAEALESPRIDSAVILALRALPDEERVELLTETGRSLTGRGRARVGDIAGVAGALSSAARLAHSRRWRARLKGARLFTALGGGSEHLRPLLDDRRPEVRAQAVEWSSDHATPGVIARLLDLLVSGDALARYAVRDALQRLGPAAVGPLEQRLAAVSGAQAAPLLRAAPPLAAAGMLPDALRLGQDGHAGTRAGAATLLAALGGERAVSVLETMLGDDDAAVRAAAARGLGRLMAWPSATLLAERLGDPAWDVRQGAALSLRALGAPGLLLLRRTLEHEDRFARDIARQVLDLPGTVEPFLP
ncbi:MAG: HEAT repeat domain-containing protein [Solirubrobacteraceae bacterium]